MSSSVRIHTVTTRTVSVKGGTTLSLHDILGTGGQKLLSQTLESLPAIQRQLGLKGEHANWLNWQKVDSSQLGTETHYRIQVATDALPNGLGQGVINIDLRLGTAVAEINYSEQIQTQQKVQQAVQQKIQQTVQQTVNQTVNNLLAVAVARRMNEQVKQYAKQYQRQEVQMRIRDSNVESYAFVGGH